MKVAAALAACRQPVLASEINLMTRRRITTVIQRHNWVHFRFDDSDRFFTPASRALAEPRLSANSLPWPAIESAIGARAEDRKTRLAKIAETVGKRVDESPVEVMRNRDPIAFLQRRSQALAQRSADLDKLAEAWQPLYNTLSKDQRQRMAAVSIFVLREMSDVADRRRAQADENED